MAEEFIPDSVWSSYKDIINRFHTDANQESVIWKKSTGGIDRYGEDNFGEGFTELTLLVLFQFNYFRTWPLSKTSQTGELDEQSAMMMINKQYAADQGYVNPEGYFDFDAAADRFIHKGILYKASGDTELAQAKDDSLFYHIVVQREDKSNSDRNV